MGCGKTHIGKKLAKALKIPFVDLDDYIVKKEKRAIPEIFASDGEAYFRKTEAECIKELQGGYVVATGGGALLNPETAEFAGSSGAVIFLDVSFPSCYGRIKGDKNRPLVQNNTKEQLQELFNRRRPVYAAHSKYTVRAGGDSGKTVAAILHILTDLKD